ncbi:TldD/PmbA family protein [soil metagenome]
MVEQALPGEQLEAYVARSRTTRVRAYGGEVESLTSAEAAGIGIRVVVDGRQGFARAGTLDEAVLAETLADARDNATFAQPDECNGLAEPDGVAPVDVDLWRPELAALPTDAKVALALELEKATTGADPRVTGVRTALYGDSAGEAAIATSTGIAGWSRATSCHLSVSALARDGDETQIGSGVSVGRRPDELDVGLAAGDAVERATRLLGARQPPSERLTVVLEPRMAASLLGGVGGMLTGERVLKGRSPFADRAGHSIASPLLTLVDDPTDARSLAADSHDAEGLACRRNVLFDGGVLGGFLHNAYTGRRAGAGSTGSAVGGYATTPGVGCQALAVVPGAGRLADLVAGVERGILVYSLHGLHSGVNPVSGDFSVGAEGVMIRDGATAEPVREITLASTLQRLLLDVTAVGADLEWLPGGTGATSLVIDDVAMGGR